MVCVDTRYVSHGPHFFSFCKLSVGLSFGVLVVNTKFGVSGVLFSKEEVLLFPFLPTLGVYPFPLAPSVYAPCRGYVAPGRE